MHRCAFYNEFPGISETDQEGDDSAISSLGAAKLQGLSLLVCRSQSPNLTCVIKVAYYKLLAVRDASLASHL